MAPQRLEKIESAPGNGMGSEVSNPQDLVHGRATDRARLGLTSRKNGKLRSCEVAKLQKKAPNALTSLDAELKSAPAFRPWPIPPAHLGRVVTSKRIIGPLALAQADGEVGRQKQCGNFPAHNALKNHKTRKESRRGID
jgi:hypothetical protein